MSCGRRGCRRPFAASCRGFARSSLSRSSWPPATSHCRRSAAHRGHAGARARRRRERRDTRSGSSSRTASRVSTLKPGTYTVVVHDKSAIHNFHLASNFDPTVDFRTDVAVRRRPVVHCDVQAEHDLRVRMRAALAGDERQLHDLARRRRHDDDAPLLPRADRACRHLRGRTGDAAPNERARRPRARSSCATARRGSASTWQAPASTGGPRRHSSARRAGRFA